MSGSQQQRQQQGQWCQQGSGSASAAAASAAAPQRTVQVGMNTAVPSTEPVTVEIVDGGSPTFAVFATASGSIPLDPARSRVFLLFSDELGEVRGATSVAVQN